MIHVGLNPPNTESIGNYIYTTMYMYMYIFKGCAPCARGLPRIREIRFIQVIFPYLEFSNRVVNLPLTSAHHSTMAAIAGTPNRMKLNCTAAGWLIPRLVLCGVSKKQRDLTIIERPGYHVHIKLNFA